jgi:hypothetical protein
MTSCCYDLQRQPLQALLQDISPLKDSKMINGGSSFADCSPLAFFRLEKLLGLVSSSSSCITHRPLLSHNWTLLGGAAIHFVIFCFIAVLIVVAPSSTVHFRHAVFQPFKFSSSLAGLSCFTVLKASQLFGVPVNWQYYEVILRRYHLLALLSNEVNESPPVNIAINEKR